MISSKLYLREKTGNGMLMFFQGHKKIPRAKEPHYIILFIRGSQPFDLTHTPRVI